MSKENLNTEVVEVTQENSSSKKTKVGTKKTAVPREVSNSLNEVSLQGLEPKGGSIENKTAVQQLKDEVAQQAKNEKLSASQPSISANKIKVTLKRSLIGCRKSHRACARGLGLLYREHTVEVLDTPENKGMINKISYLLRVE